MKPLILLLSILLASAVQAQSIPNGGISPGQVWSTPQWISAWQSKADTASPLLTGTVTINGVPVPTYFQTAAEIAANVPPVNYQYLPGNVLRYGATIGVDCTVALQSAVNSNAEVTFPTGAWIINSTPTVPADVVIRALPGSSFTGTGAVALGLQLTDSYQYRVVEGDTITGPAFRDVSRIQHVYGGSAMQGGRNSFEVQSSLVSTSSASNGNRNYTAGLFQGQASANDNGTNPTAAGTSAGAVFGLNAVALLTGTATSFLNLAGVEVNVGAAPGTSVYARNGVTIADLASTVQGAIYDSALNIGSQPGAPGWVNGVLFSRENGQPPVTAGGCLICTQDAFTVTSGINITSATITGNSFSAPGNVAIAGNGGVLLGPFLANEGIGTLNAANGLYVSGAPVATYPLNLAPTNQQFAPAAKIQRLNDRVMVADAAINDGLFPNVTKDWLSAFQTSQAGGPANGTLLGVQMGVLADQTTPMGGAFLAAANSLNGTASGPDVLSLSSFAVNNNTSFPIPAWAYYGEAHRMNNTAGQTVGMEIDVVQRGSLQLMSPYIQAAGEAVGHIIAAGAGMSATGQFNATAGIMFGANPMPFDKGIVFQATSIAGTNGVTGTGYAMNYAKGHVEQWWAVGTGTGTPTGYIVGNGTTNANAVGIDMEEGYLNITAQGGLPHTHFTGVAGAVNYFNFLHSATGTPLSLQAQGSDTNVGINLVPKGSGAVTIAGVPVTAGPAGTAIGDIPQLINFQGGGRPGLYLQGGGASGGLALSRTSWTSADAQDVIITRTANYSGGSSSLVNNAFYAGTTVSAGTQSFEWTGTFFMDNNGTITDGSQDVALYARSIKEATGRTWAATFELDDKSVSPAATSVTSEFDMYANGLDANSSRVILDIIGAKLPGGSGVTPSITYGWRIGGQNGTLANATFAYGGYFYTATYTSLIGSSAALVATNGVDLSASTFSGSAFKSNGFSVNGSGVVSQAAAIETGTAFTVSGCGTAGTIVGGSTAGSFVVGTGATPCAFTITMGGGITATHGWVCKAYDVTKNLPLAPTAAGVNTASCVVTSSINGTSNAVATSDVIQFSADGY